MSNETVLTEKQKTYFIRYHGSSFTAIHVIEKAVLQSELVQAWKLDAERYRWLRTHHSTWGRIEMGHDESMPINMDATIDAAMEQKT